MSKVRTVERSPEEARVAWLRFDAYQRLQREAEERAAAVGVLRDRGADRARSIGAVCVLSGVCGRKVLRLLDEGLGTSETRRRVRAVLDTYHRPDLDRA